jgi:hypothetical protein
MDATFSSGALKWKGGYEMHPGMTDRGFSVYSAERQFIGKYCYDNCSVNVITLTRF